MKPFPVLDIADLVTMISGRGKKSIFPTNATGNSQILLNPAILAKTEGEGKHGPEREKNSATSRPAARRGTLQRGNRKRSFRDGEGDLNHIAERVLPLLGGGHLAAAEQVGIVQMASASYRARAAFI
jgi:hypothetical protein